MLAFYQARLERFVTKKIVRHFDKWQISEVVSFLCVKAEPPAKIRTTTKKRKRGILQQRAASAIQFDGLSIAFQRDRVRVFSGYKLNCN